MDPAEVGSRTDSTRRRSPRVRGPGLLSCAAAFLLLAAGSSWPDGPAAPPPGWHLVWSDEFSGPGLDLGAWTAELGDGSPQNPGWGNSEAEYCTDGPANLSVVPDGPLSVLRITARSEHAGNKYYTSARIKTQGKKAFAYGRIEARIRLPQGCGLWPAFWLLGESIGARGWPACGEIDILEMRGGNDASVLGTMHWADAAGSHASSIPVVARLPSGAFADAYHIFGLAWDDHSLTWLLDGVAYGSQNLDEPGQETFRGHAFFLLLNLAIGGRFLSGEIPPLGFTDASMDVDWVRWYQRD